MPPPAVNVQPPPVLESQTTRERFKIHLTEQVCSSCHNLIDPIGFVFEHYDGIGAYRADENGKKIDDSGEIQTTSATNGPIEGVIGLGDKLEQSVDIQSCFARQWFRYAYGVEESAELSCLMQDIVQSYTGEDTTFEELVLTLVQSDHFFSRIDSEEPAGVGMDAVTQEFTDKYPGEGASGTQHDPNGALKIEELHAPNSGSTHAYQYRITNISDENAEWAIYLPHIIKAPTIYESSIAKLENVNGCMTKFSGIAPNDILLPQGTEVWPQVSGVTFGFGGQVAAKKGESCSTARDCLSCNCIEGRGAEPGTCE
jgi:hypothetical protein